MAPLGNQLRRHRGPLLVVAALLVCASLIWVVAAQTPQPPPSSADTNPTADGGPYSVTGEPAWSAPDPNRPVVDLSYDVAADLHSATGELHIEFHPDLPVCELIFRAWPNKPTTANTGNALTITQAQLGSTITQVNVDPAGAPPGHPGTLIQIPLGQCVPAGTDITATLRFHITLGPGTDERVGVSRTGQLAWFGTAFPMLAWQRTRGWAREDAVTVVGETATSEAFRLHSLRVSAPDAFAVLAVGQLVGTTRDPAMGVITHEFAAEAVRDVAVTVGSIDVLDRTVGQVRVHLGGPAYPGRADLSAWADQVESAITRLQDYLGPFPYQDLWVSVIPDQSDGTEFPSAIQLGRLRFPRQAYIITHEVAHQYFYALVGNNQAESPWLDESLTSFVQRVVDDPNHDPALDDGFDPRLGDQWGRSMAQWQDTRSANSAYEAAVYEAGPDALIEARRAVGATKFDAALRQYLHANAESIATRDDFAAAFAALPEALAILNPGLTAHTTTRT